MTPRQGFIGKELDSESDLADHGVRKYDYITGRFMAVDPLWEKYRVFNT
jgi:RHS repeat-associated protein